MDPTVVDNDRNQVHVLRCLLFERDTMDVLCDSLRLQCHEIREALDGLEIAGLVEARGAAGIASLTFGLTAAGRARALDGLDGRERDLAEQGLAPDDVEYLRQLARGAAPPRRSDREWGTGATRQRLWQAGLVDVVGFIRPRSVLTAGGRARLDAIGGDPT